MKKRSGRVDVMAVGLLLFCVCLSANTAFGLGGGGSHGDGRWDYAPPAAPNSSGGSSVPSNVQQPSGLGGGDSTVGANVSDFCWEIAWYYGDGPRAPYTVPEPFTALLLGVGIIGLVAAKRRFST